MNNLLRRDHVGVALIGGTLTKNKTVVSHSDMEDAKEIRITSQPNTLANTNARDLEFAKVFFST